MNIKQIEGYLREIDTAKKELMIEKLGKNTLTTITITSKLKNLNPI